MTVTVASDGSPNAPTNAGSYTVIGTVVDVNYAGAATNTLTIAKSNAVVTLGNLSQVYDGTAKSASATTVPPGLTVTLTYDGSPNAPTNAGGYTVIGTIVNVNYAGAATNTLTIAKSNAVVTLGSLSEVSDGTAKSASATTAPPGLTVTLTYDGSADAPRTARSSTHIRTSVEVNSAGA